MANLHIFIGEDDYLIGEMAKKVVGDGAGLEVIDSRNSSNEELRLRDIREADASFSTPPFLDPRKVTWWKNVGFLPGGATRKGEDEKVSEAVKEALARFAEKLAASPLPENQHFILSGPHLLKTSTIAKRLATVAEMAVFAAGKPWEVARQAVVRVIDLAAEDGLKFAPGAAEKFVSVVGTDSRSLVSELAKMRAYLGEGETTVTAAAVDAVTCPGVGVEPEVWAITDAIGERDLGKALAATEKFEGSGGFAVLVTTVVEKFFRQMIDVAAGRTDGMNPYALKKMGGFLRNWKPLELRIARGRFLMLRERVVSGLPSGDLVVVNEIVRTVRR